MNPQAEPPKQKPELAPQEIEQVFSMLKLDKEEERKRLRVLTKANLLVENPTRIILSGTTSLFREQQGGENA